MPEPFPAHAEGLPSYRRNQFGLKLMLLSLGIGFAAMLVLYGVLRNQLPTWPPHGQPRLPIFWPSINTLIVLLSSWSMHQAVLSVRRGRPRAFSRWVLLTTNFGVAFLVAQVLLSRQAIGMGIKVGYTLYGSLLFLLGAFHATHLLVGVVALGVISAAALSRDYTPSRLGQVIGWSRYWHFVSMAWLVMYVFLFLL